MAAYCITAYNLALPLSEPLAQLTALGLPFLGAAAAKAERRPPRIAFTGTAHHASEAALALAALVSFLEAAAITGDLAAAIAAMLLVVFIVAFRSLVAYTLGVKLKDAWTIYCYATLAQVLLSPIRVPGIALASAAATASALSSRREPGDVARTLAPFALEGALNAAFLLVR